MTKNEQIKMIERIFHYKMEFYSKTSFSVKNFSEVESIRRKIEDLIVEFFSEDEVVKIYDSESSQSEMRKIIPYNYYLPHRGDKFENLLQKLSLLLENSKVENNKIFIHFYDLSKENNNLAKFLNKEYRYSEIFGNTFQGEGKYTGINTVWYRSWGCNFNCSGFGQENPYDPSTWKLDYLEIDPRKYNSMEELPVFKRGCDSSYSWSKRFSKLSRKGTPSSIVDEIENRFLKNEYNIEGKFLHSNSKQFIHMAFTGGEPMLSQSALIGILLEFFYRNNLPPFVTVETNGTINLREDLKFLINLFYSKSDDYHINITRIKEKKSDFFFEHRRKNEWFWSVSPKLSLSGEKWEEAIRPEIVSEYAKVSNFGQLKFVVDGSEKIWNEVNKAVDLYRKSGIDWDVWIMPVGANKEDQEKIQAHIAEEALKRGYYVSPRVHCWVFGNVIGK